MSTHNVAAPPPVPCARCGGVNRAQARFCRRCGINLATGTVATVTTTAAPAPGEQSSRSLRRRLLILAAVVAVIAAGVAAYYRVQTTGEQSPKGPVKAFFAALERESYEQALTYVGSSSPLLKAGALKKGYRPPGPATIGEVTYGEPDDDTKRPNKNIARVRVEFDVGENHYETIVQLERERSGITRAWRIVSGATGYLDVISPSVKTARVANATVDTIAAERASNSVDGSIEALPGEYTIGVDGPLVTAEVVTHVVGGRADRLTATELPLKVNPDAVDEVNNQVRAKADDCATETDLNPTKCPFELGEFVYDAADVRWKIDSYPEIELKVSDDPEFGPVEVRTKTPGKATVTYAHLGETKTATVDVKVAGTVTVKRGKIVWN